VSRYFNYRSRDDLEQDIRARGLAIELASGTKSVLSLISIGGRTAGNRLAVQPMEGCDGGLDGSPGELTFRRWERFGAGGAKLIWGEATAVVPEGRANPRQLLIEERTAPELRELLKRTRHAHRERFGRDDDLIVGLQLTHSGRFSHPTSLIPQHAPPLDAVRRLSADYPVLSDTYLGELEEAYVRAAILAAGVGFDFVDIKQCHGYLLNELLGSRERDGRYGGGFEGRTRFVTSVIRKIRSKLEDRLLIASRVNVFDGPPFADGGDGSARPMSDRPYRWGFGTNPDNPIEPDLSEPLRLVGMLREAGVSLLNVTMGSPYWNPHIGRPFERPPVDGYWPPEHPLVGVERHFELTAAVQRAFPDLGVMGSGYSWLRHYAASAGEANIQAGRVSIMGLGRGAIAYPDFAADLMERGEMVDRKACIGVSYCTALMRAKNNDLGQLPVGCVPRDPLFADEFKLMQQAAPAGSR
jgi:2,4-dienoyl-CoA reductase-like NADH-dependent reductase (Old Yellow Enzyme family)